MRKGRGLPWRCVFMFHSMVISNEVLEQYVEVVSPMSFDFDAKSEQLLLYSLHPLALRGIHKNLP